MTPPSSSFADAPDRADPIELLAAVSADLPTGVSKCDGIAELLAEQLTGQEPGTPVPSERAVSEHFGVARMTARQAIDRLVEQGLVVRIPRRATVVGSPRHVHTRHLTSYAEDIRSRGMVPGGRVLSRTVGPATGAEAAGLCVVPGSPVIRLVRLRTADSEPLARSTSVLSAERFPGLETLPLPDGSLHDVLLERWGVWAARHEQRIRPTHLTAVEARDLNVDLDELGLEVTATSVDAEGRIIEHGRTVYRADRYDLTVVTQSAGASPRTGAL